MDSYFWLLKTVTFRHKCDAKYDKKIDIELLTIRKMIIQAVITVFYFLSKSKHQNSSNQINILPNLLPCIHLLCAQYRVSVVWGSLFGTIQHQHHCTAATKTSKYKLKENLNQCRGTNKINQIKIFFKYWNTNWFSIDSKNDLVCLNCVYILYCIICQLQLGIFRVDANICSD